MRGTITREEARDMAEAHAQGLHADLPREGCPECEGRELRDYPRAADVTTIKLSEAERREVAQLTAEEQQGYRNLRESSVSHAMALAVVRSDPKAAAVHRAKANEHYQAAEHFRRLGLEQSEADARKAARDEDETAELLERGPQVQR